MTLSAPVLEHRNAVCCPGEPNSMSTEYGANDKASAPIDRDRFDRALTQDLATERFAENLYDVGSNDDGVPYRVDLHTAMCECPDARYRDVVCKTRTRGGDRRASRPGERGRTDSAHPANARVRPAVGPTRRVPGGRLMVGPGFGGYEPDGYDHDPLDEQGRIEDERPGCKSSRLGNNRTLDTFVAADETHVQSQRPGVTALKAD